MMYLSRKQAEDLLLRLKGYEASKWDYDVHTHTLELTTKAGAKVVVRYRTWRKWESPDLSHNHQYQLSVQDNELGVQEEDGTHKPIWEVIDLASLYDHVVNHETSKRKREEIVAQKQRIKEQVQEKLEAAKQALVDLV